MNWDTAIERFKIGKAYHEASMENIEKVNKSLSNIGKTWLANPEKQSLYLTGNPGSGKTYFCIALLKGLIDQKMHPWIIFKRSDELDDELLRSVEERSESFVLEKYHEVPFLFIDDLGVERVNDRIIKQYYSIIDRRLNDMLPTIFTSNISLDNIKNNLGERIASRLGMTHGIKFPDRDLRK